MSNYDLAEVVGRGLAAIAAALRHPRWAAPVDDKEYEDACERIGTWVFFRKWDPK